MQTHSVSMGSEEGKQAGIRAGVTVGTEDWVFRKGLEPKSGGGSLSSHRCFTPEQAEENSPAYTAPREMVTARSDLQNRTILDLCCLKQPCLEKVIVITIGH